jgi:uncharacterized protein (TIGR03437 family)
VSSVPVPVRGEGISERLGDILISCAGSNPGAVFSGNLTLVVPFGITNRVGSNGLLNDAVIAADLGLGFVQLPATAQVSGNLQIVFSGVNVTVPQSGNLALRISNVRVAAAQSVSAVGMPIRAQVLSASGGLPLIQSQVIAGVAQPSLFATLYNRGAIACAGSPLPESISMPSLFAAGTLFVSSRITEGFASAFLPRAAAEDTGVRFLIRFSGFPAGVRVFVPDYVAGSGAATQTAGGDLGVAQSPGAYVPGSASLLLGRVSGPDASGAGGTVARLAAGGPIALTGASEVALASGSGSVVYEVLDSNPAARESAQIPVFVGAPSTTGPATAYESISYAPVSNVVAASSDAPIPRFLAVPPGDDCALSGDCTAQYFPKLVVEGNPVRFTAVSGGGVKEDPGYIRVLNEGGGIMPWTVTVRYESGSGWAFLDSTSGVNNASVRVNADAKTLAPGTYRATVFIDAGARAGNGSVPVTLVVSPAPPAGTGGGSGTGATGSGSGGASPAPTPAVQVTRILNGASLEPTPLVAGSIGTAMGVNLAGKSVAVALDGVPAEVLYDATTQINFVVPAALRNKNSATLVVTVDGTSSAPQTVVLAPAWPAIFKRGVLNQDNTLNEQNAPAKSGSVLQIYATGVPAGAPVSVQIGDIQDLVPLYAGPAPTVAGVQQINVPAPEGVSGSVPLIVCATAGAQSFCSPSYTVVVE